jgi:kinesin family protein 13
VEIHELDDDGNYVPVPVVGGDGVLTGGVYQLKQGQQRRIMCSLTQVGNHAGTLPLVAHHVSSIAVGCVCDRSRTLQRPLDSYQELHLDTIKEQWAQALQSRRVYLDEQIQR